MADSKGFSYVQMEDQAITEYVKFAEEIVRKNNALSNAYSQVNDSITALSDLSGYDVIDQMKEDLKNVKTEIEEMSARMQEAMDSLQS